jgi:hypothetical protein
MFILIVGPMGGVKEDLERAAACCSAQRGRGFDRNDLRKQGNAPDRLKA